MRTAMFVLLVAAVASAQTVEIDGKKVALSGKLKTASLFDVQVVPYAATHGPDRVRAIAGSLISHLPTEYYRVTVTVQFWYKGSGSNSSKLYPWGHATATVTCPPPGRRVKWSAIMKSGTLGSNTSDARGRHDGLHTVSVEFEKHIPSDTLTPPS